MKKELPKRKHPRLNNYDYSTAGAYFVAICTQSRQCLLSRIVGRGLAPAEKGGIYLENDKNSTALCEIRYTEYGKIAKQQLLLLEKRYPCVTIDQYVIMPNHIHIVLFSDNETVGASPRPTIMDVIRAYKSLTTRECKKICPIDKLFQTSFYEHVIRNRDDYDEIVKYIYENPILWYYDELYTEEQL